LSRVILKAMQIAIFDLDGTLAESKSRISPPMIDCLKRLLEQRSVAVISGGAWPQFETQLVGPLSLSPDLSKRLHLFPTSGTSFYDNPDGRGWKQVYCENLTDAEVDRIMVAFRRILSDPGVKMPTRLWGDQIENRGTQVTFSAMGQLAPVAEKKKWDPTFFKRLILIERLMQHLPEFDLRAGGSTSIDVTRKGIDKSYGIQQIEKHLGYARSDMLFIGDALFPGGNDHAVLSTGVTCIETSGPEFTSQIIEKLLSGSI
jgi:HAD superfamily hydrolase (TIGR01484 family)